MIIEPFQKRTWAEIDLDAIKCNYKQIKEKVGNAKVCCVVKANAYGHGAIQLARVYEELGADFFAVSNIEEALQLRNNNIESSILILGYTDPRCAKILSENNISQCVYSEEYGEELSQNALKTGVNVKIHIKLDTGMGRIGFRARQIENLDLGTIIKVCSLPGLDHEGIFTHFASADEGDVGMDYTYAQFNCFCGVIEELKKHSIKFEIRHCANSAAIFEYPEMHLDMVRAGIILYGLQPSSQLKCKPYLKQVMTLHSIVSHIKDIDSNDSVSYGRTYVASQNRKIATIPIGYADGLWRANGTNGMLFKINGMYAPVVGRICMDQCMVDITEIEGVYVGSNVTVYGIEDNNSIDKIAENNNTINYEIVCAVGERVPRVYIENGVINCIEDNIARV